MFTPLKRDTSGHFDPYQPCHSNLWWGFSRVNPCNTRYGPSSMRDRTGMNAWWRGFFCCMTGRKMADINPHPQSPCNEAPSSRTCKDAIPLWLSACLLTILGGLAALSLGFSSHCVDLCASGPGPTITVIFNLDQ